MNQANTQSSVQKKKKVDVLFFSKNIVFQTQARYSFFLAYLRLKIFSKIFLNFRSIEYAPSVTSHYSPELFSGFGENPLSKVAAFTPTFTLASGFPQ